MKKIIALIIAVIIIFSCSLDPYGEGLGNNSTGHGDYVSCKPSAPSGFVQTDLSSNSITFSWEAAEAAISYNIYRGQSFIANAKTPFLHINTNITSATIHLFRITTINECGESVGSAFFDACVLPNPPTNVSVSKQSNRRMEISWDNDWSALYYNVYRSESSQGTYSLIANKIGGAGSGRQIFTDTTFDASKNNFYRITAVISSNDGSIVCESEMSNYAACILPTAPMGVKAEGISSNQIRISWNRIEGASSYRVYWATSATGTYSLISSSTITDTIFTRSSLTSSTTYFFKVSAVSCYESEMSEVVSATTLPRAPTGVKGTALSTSQIEVSWDRVENTDIYKIYRAENRDGEYKFVGSTADTSFIDENLATSTGYYHKVSAVNKNGVESELSNYRETITKKCDVSPTIPTGLSAEVLSPTSIKYSWNEVFQAKYYMIYTATSETGRYTFLDISDSLSIINNRLSASTTYYIKMIAVNDCGFSDTSNIVSATTFECPEISVPKNVSAQALSASEIKISWTLTDDAESYNIYRAANETEEYAFIANTKETTFINNSNLLPVRTYYYKITALTNCGESKMSNFANATTESCPPPPIPSGFSAEVLSENSIKISWNKIDGAYYETYRAESKDGIYLRVSFNVGLSYFTDGNLKPSTTYFYKIRSFNNCGQSEFSDIISATTLNCDLPETSLLPYR